jgi:sugar lactone lactonase YvrE
VRSRVVPAVSPGINEWLVAATEVRQVWPMRFVAAALAFGSVFAAEPGEKTHQDYRRVAEAAYQRKDYTAAKEATLAALDLRPDSPRYLYNLAALSALTNDAASAIATLREIAAMGVVLPIQRDPDFAKLQGTPDFLKVLQLFAANREPRGNADVVAELPGRTGIIEGLAFRPRTGDVFLSDVHHRCIFRRDGDGRVTRFTAEDDELLGIFGIAIDEARNALWAVTTAVPEMSGYAKEQRGHTGLAEFNLATSELRRVVVLAGDGRENALGDLVVAPDGTVYVSDSKAPVIWQLAPGAEEFQKVVDSPLFSSLQGLVLEKSTLLVADHANGLFSIDLPTAAITALKAPKNTTLVGLDGLVAVRGGVVATQNGVEPQRMIRIGLAADFQAVTDVTVLASGLPNLSDLTLVTLVNGRPTVVAGAGWDNYTPGKTPQPAPHTVRLVQIEMP